MRANNGGAITRPVVRIMQLDDTLKRDDMAELLGVTPTCINTWTKQGMPKKMRGK